MYGFGRKTRPGGLLRFDMVQCKDDAAVLQRASGRALPEGCISVEISREKSFVWRGKGPRERLGAAVGEHVDGLVRRLRNWLLHARAALSISGRFFRRD